MEKRTKKEVLDSEKLPKAVGPYSLGIKAGHFLFISGQLGLDPNTNQIIGGGIAAQTNQALENLKILLTDNGFELSDVVKTTVFLKDMNDFSALNEVYAKYFNQDSPARSTIQVAALPKDGLVEIDAIAIDKKCECDK